MSILSYLENHFLFQWLSIRLSFAIILLQKLSFKLFDSWHSWYVANYSSQYWHNYNFKVNYYDSTPFKIL